MADSPIPAATLEIFRDVFVQTVAELGMRVSIDRVGLPVVRSYQLRTRHRKASKKVVVHVDYDDLVFLHSPGADKLTLLRMEPGDYEVDAMHLVPDAEGDVRIYVLHHTLDGKPVDLRMMGFMAGYGSPSAQA